MHIHHVSISGKIEVICGPMFSGKTEELIRRVRRAQIARQKIQIFKPAIDTRYDEKDVVSHSSQSVSAIPVKDSLDILRNLKDCTRVVAIDEVQFFDENICVIANKLAQRGLRVICAGLDLDFRGVPFGPIPNLLALADDITKIGAICTVCGALATKSYRKTKSSERVLLGESDVYEARCRTHYEYEVEDDMDAPPENNVFQESLH